MNNNGGSISWKTCMKLIISALVVFLLFRYWGTFEGFLGLLLGGLTAIISGLVIAYIVNIPMRFFEGKLPGETGDGTLNRTLALILAFVCIIAVALVVLLLVLPELVNAIVTLTEDAPDIIRSITDTKIVQTIVPAETIEQINSINWSQVTADVAAWLESGVMSNLDQIGSLVGRIGAIFMGVIFAFWFLLEKNKLSKDAHGLIRIYIGKDFDERLSRMIGIADKCFHGYIVGQTLESFLFGTLVALIAVVLGLPYAPMLGALVGAMSLIPMVGAIIGAIIGALIIFATSWQQALIFLVVFFIAQQIEANFLYMRVVGKQVGLTGMWPLIGVTLGAALFGIIGAFLGVPLTATIFRIVENDVKQREQLPDDAPTPLNKLQKKMAD